MELNGSAESRREKTLIYYVGSNEKKLTGYNGYEAMTKGHARCDSTTLISLGRSEATRGSSYQTQFRYFSTKEIRGYINVTADVVISGASPTSARRVSFTVGLAEANPNHFAASAWRV